MEKEYRVLIADDHPIFLQGVVSILSKNTELEIIGQANNGRKALELIKQENPDIAILDVQMPGMDGFEVAKNAMIENPDTKIILLTMFIEESFVRKVFEVGIKGYVLKESAVIDIQNCIESVIEDRLYLSPQISHYLLKMNLKEKNSDKKELTNSEKRILALIAEGKSSMDIAETLFISYKTVENHRSNICKKLGITGNAALLKYALRTKTMQ